jgi:aminoglycoside phosphotransferase (APT) family kinase protein
MPRTQFWLHGVDIAAVGLASFGRPQDYCVRQTARWTKQYRASETRPVEAIDALNGGRSRFLPIKRPLSCTAIPAWRILSSTPSSRGSPQ